MSTFRVAYGWSNSHKITVPAFGDALQIAKTLLETETFGKGRQRPTIRCEEREDCDTDGLTAEQREDCEAAGLEVRRP